ncbi:MAG: DNA-protecting protein DprA [Spirochaetales bacterium]|nr:DNA-protecting protein DprA [Spirochaetales bacterium]
MKYEITLLLAINRLRFLSLAEKTLLTEKVKTTDRFSTVSLDELQHFIGRTTRIQTWDPQQIATLAEGDGISLTRGEFAYTFYWDATYPPLLRETFNPPFLLFFRGRLPEPDFPSVAVVGTRYPTGQGKKAAFQLGMDLGAAGIPVVSGLARGIDISAHIGNIRGGGRSIAVLGCGIDRVYPASNEKAARDLIRSGGCIFSEYAPGTPPLRYNFPERNRIISGLARAVVVVEAPQKSGALITADFALSQGRDLYVHGHCLGTAAGRGCSKLVNEGALEITVAGDIFKDWGLNANPTRGPAEKPSHPLQRELDGNLLAYAGEYFERNSNG